MLRTLPSTSVNIFFECVHGKAGSEGTYRLLSLLGFALQETLQKGINSTEYWVSSSRKTFIVILIGHKTSLIVGTHKENICIFQNCKLKYVKMKWY